MDIWLVYSLRKGVIVWSFLHISLLCIYVFCFEKVFFANRSNICPGSLHLPHQFTIHFEAWKRKGSKCCWIMKQIEPFRVHPLQFWTIFYVKVLKCRANRSTTCTLRFCKYNLRQWTIDKLVVLDPLNHTTVSVWDQHLVLIVVVCWSDL